MRTYLIFRHFIIAFLRPKLLYSTMRELKRGSLIVLEGCDRAGKTTQIAKLNEILTQNGKSIKIMRFPDRSTAIGKTIDCYLKQTSDLSDRAIHLLFSANRWELVPQILSDLEGGTTILVDRYAYSGVAFSAAKGLGLNWCKNPDRGLPQPDAVLFLDLPPKLAESRGGFGDERYEKVVFQNKVYEVYNKLVDETWTKVDASQPLDTVSGLLVQKCMQVIEGPKKEIGKLWVDETSD